MKEKKIRTIYNLIHKEEQRLEFLNKNKNIETLLKLLFIGITTLYVIALAVYLLNLFPSIVNLLNTFGEPGSVYIIFFSYLFLFIGAFIGIIVSTINIGSVIFYFFNEIDENNKISIHMLFEIEFFILVISCIFIFLGTLLL